MYFEKVKYLQNWKNNYYNNYKELEECKTYIRLISDIEFDRICLKTTRTNNIRIGFIKNDKLNKEKFIDVDIDNKIYNIKEADYNWIKDKIYHCNCVI